MGPVITEAEGSPVCGACISRDSFAADSETVAFEPPVAWRTDYLNSRAETRDPILANFRVLARTNALLRAVLNEY
jgi:hypothetical protein